MGVARSTVAQWEFMDVWDWVWMSGSGLSWGAVRSTDPWTFFESEETAEEEKLATSPKLSITYFRLRQR